MKQKNIPLPTTSLKCHANTRKVCFPVGRFVLMSLIYELTTKLCVTLVKLMKLYGKRPVLTSQFDVSKLQKQLQSAVQIHLDQSANFGPLPLNVCVRVSHDVAFNSINC